VVTAFGLAAVLGAGSIGLAAIQNGAWLIFLLAAVLLFFAGKVL